MYDLHRIKVNATQRTGSNTHERVCLGRMQFHGTEADARARAATLVRNLQADGYLFVVATVYSVPPLFENLFEDEAGISRGAEFDFRR